MILRKSVAAFWLLCCCLFLVSCSNKSEEKPPFTPLSMAEADRGLLYGAQPGPFKVAEINPIELQPEANADYPVDDAFPVKIVYPEAEGPFPLLLFVHGFGADMNQYGNVVDHWVSHGYVVLATTHIDSASLFFSIINSMRYGQLGLMMRRPQEVAFALEKLPALQAQYPQLKNKIDYNNIALTGHSFGGFTAQMFAGALAFDEDGVAQRSYKDDRIKAVVALSPPGEMFDVVTTKSWLEVDKPMLVATGTWDSNSFFWPDWRAHLLSYDTAKPGQNTSLVVEGMDHYYGNLICRLDREEAPQHDALLMVNSVSTAFLDAHLKGKQAAANYVNGDQLAKLTGSFAKLERR